MIKTIYPSEITGSINAPPSKSLTQRAIAAALLARGITEISNPSFCNDSLAGIEMAERLGASVTRGNDYLKIGGSLKPLHEVNLNCGESGLALRMFSPIAALLSGKCTFTGEGSLNARPVLMITEALSKLGVTAESNNGLLPLILNGYLKGGKIEIDGSSGSQILTGLLMSLPLASCHSDVTVENLKSKPYIDLTLKLLTDFGIRVENQNYKRFIIPGNQAYKARIYSIEGDWSGSAFMLVGGAIAGDVTVRNLQSSSLQADAAIIEALKRAGADLIFENNSVRTVKTNLKSFDFDATESPDLFPPLACLAVNCKGTSRIKGVSRLEYKESNRTATITRVLNELGINVSVSGDEMVIEGGKVSGAVVSSHNDHRIAMMAAIAALTSNGCVTVTEAESVSKSYPGFFDDLKTLKADIG